MQQLPLQFEFKGNENFGNFYPENNQELLEQLKNCSAGNGQPFIFLHGQSGHGKTHLLHASCKHAQQLGRSSFYLGFTGSPLAEPEIVTGLENYDLVCLDDIDRIAGDSVWELAIFNLYNQLQGLGHALIVASSLKPNKAQFSLPDLRTRLNWGLTLSVNSLSDTGKIAALTLRAGQMGLEIPPAAGQFLLTHYHRNLASLWTLLEQLDRATLAAQRKLTVPFLKQFLTNNHDL